MHYLIVTAHPVQSSLTHGVVQRIAAGIAEGSHSVEIADLAAEGFDPRFSTDDISAFQLQAPIPADVLAEQQRIDRADAVILVYPVYWWSMPGQLKGWIDRVFTNGWAYQDGGDGKVKKKLSHLRVHLAAIGAADRSTYDRHGYTSAIQTQIDHGIFDYCGAQVVTSELLLTPEFPHIEALLASAQALGSKMAGVAQSQMAL
ncbi:NAD(P)H-dependent oxidoreductase [Serratia odorifera]|uniref:NAD(P)H-dependent oxidoreductase n=1 Tax=Serratia odorifera TaxID=618 RepID=UPI003531A977